MNACKRMDTYALDQLSYATANLELWYNRLRPIFTLTNILTRKTLSHISANNNQHKYTPTAVFHTDYITVALTGQFADNRSRSICRLVTGDWTVCGMVNLPIFCYKIM